MLSPFQFFGLHAHDFSHKKDASKVIEELSYFLSRKATEQKEATFQSLNSGNEHNNNGLLTNYKMIIDDLKAKLGF